MREHEWRLLFDIPDKRLVPWHRLPFGCDYITLQDMHTLMPLSKQSRYLKGPFKNSYRFKDVQIFHFKNFNQTACLSPSAILPNLISVPQGYFCSLLHMDLWIFSQFPQIFQIM